MQLTKNFSAEEFMCDCGECIYSSADEARMFLSTDLIMRLQSVRTVYGKSISINSGIRCPSHNGDIGGSDGSSHVPENCDGKCTAADIKCDNSVDRFRLLEILMSDFSRIGIHKNFIHVDVDKSKEQGVMWAY